MQTCCLLIICSNNPVVLRWLHAVCKKLKMDKLDLIFEEMVFSRKKNLYVIYTATMEHFKIGEKSDVIAVSMATMTFQYSGYLSFKLM